MPLTQILTTLILMQKNLDSAGLQLAAIYLEHAIDEILNALEDGKPGGDRICDDALN